MTSTTIRVQSAARTGPRPVAVVLDFVGTSPTAYESLVRRLGLELGGPGLPGCRFNWARRTPDGLRVMEVWEDRDLFEVALRDQTLPAIRDAGLPDPEVTCYEVHGYLTGGKEPWEVRREPADE